MTHTYTRTHTDLPVLKAGIYRHYKGPLYLVLGYAHDANADGDADGEHSLWVRFTEVGPRGKTPLNERTVVVYIPLEGIKDETEGSPRMAVRTHEDFFAEVCMRPEHTHYGKPTKDGDVCHPAPRFQYVSASWTGDRA